MPAITVEDTLVLPRIPRPDPTSRPRPVAKLVTSEDYQGGRLGTIPADQLTPRRFA